MRNSTRHTYSVLLRDVEELLVVEILLLDVNCDQTLGNGVVFVLLVSVEALVTVLLSCVKMT